MLGRMVFAIWGRQHYRFWFCHFLSFFASCIDHHLYTYLLFLLVFCIIIVSKCVEVYRISESEWNGPVKSGGEGG